MPPCQLSNPGLRFNPKNKRTTSGSRCTNGVRKCDVRPCAKYEKYCQNVLNLLENNEIRGLLDSRSETIGKKIRDAELDKIPFMIVIGEQESDKNEISLRSQGGKDYGKMKINDFVKIIKDKIKIEV